MGDYDSDRDDKLTKSNATTRNSNHKKKIENIISEFKVPRTTGKKIHPYELPYFITEMSNVPAKEHKKGAMKSCEPEAYLHACQGFMYGQDKNLADRLAKMEENAEVYWNRSVHNITSLDNKNTFSFYKNIQAKIDKMEKAFALEEEAKIAKIHSKAGDRARQQQMELIEDEIARREGAMLRSLEYTTLAMSHYIHQKLLTRAKAEAVKERKKDFEEREKKTKRAYLEFEENKVKEREDIARMEKQFGKRPSSATSSPANKRQK
jgi:hypothetical protein